MVAKIWNKSILWDPTWHLNTQFDNMMIYSRHFHSQKLWLLTCVHFLLGLHHKHPFPHIVVVIWHTCRTDSVPVLNASLPFSWDPKTTTESPDFQNKEASVQSGYRIMPMHISGRLAGLILFDNWCCWLCFKPWNPNLRCGYKNTSPSRTL